MITILVIGTAAAFFLAYRLYGRFLARRLDLNDANITPACAINDNVDYVPAKAPLLLGQHFSAIAAAGPIVGPILAAIWFGWLPAVLWVVLGAVFIGGVHDFSTLVASVKHKGLSIGELVNKYISPRSYTLFLIFIWITLMYLIITFVDITAQTFKAASADEAFGPSVAAISLVYLLLAGLMGILLRAFKVRLSVLTAIFLPLLFVFIWLSARLPDSVVAALSSLSATEWSMILLAYCLIASVIPAWTLLQPRGYLGGWLLYLTIAASFIGTCFGGFSIRYPALNMQGFNSLANGRSLFPLLFITIACGACSGFHGIVGSGTTSKQLYKETDARPIGYGAMLLEGLVAIFAIVTVMILGREDAALKADPNMIYANGIAKYLGLLGIDPVFALTFALLAFSTFVYDTLDVCTRLGRIIFQELVAWKGFLSNVVSTLVSLVFPFVFLLLAGEKGYLVAWPIFGTSNQLLAGFALMAVSFWLVRTHRNALFAVLPMAFMLAMTVWSLILHIIPFYQAVFSPGGGRALDAKVITSGTVGTILFGLTILLAVEAARAFLLKKERA